MTNPTTLVAMKQATHVLIQRSFTTRKQNPRDHTKVKNTTLSKEESSEKVRHMFHFWQERTLCKTMQIQEEDSSQATSTH